MGRTQRGGMSFRCLTLGGILLRKYAAVSILLEPKQRVANGIIKVQYEESSVRLPKTREQRALRDRARAVEGFMTQKTGCTLSRSAAPSTVYVVTGREIWLRLSAPSRSVWVWSTIGRHERTEASGPASLSRKRAPNPHLGKGKSSSRPVKRCGPTFLRRLQNDRNRTDFRSRTMIDRHALIPKKQTS